MYLNRVTSLLNLLMDEIMYELWIDEIILHV